jgi:tRNA (guanine-N7-)-methyltransferase
MSAVVPAGRPRLHGRRRGKKLRPRQAGLLAELLPQLAIPDDDLPLDPRGLFRQPVKAVWLEIGFGGGEHLAHIAARHRDFGFLGCEPFINGVAKAVSRIAEHQLDNVRLYVGDAAALLERMPDACLARVHLFYPDPWPKRRHRERRFISDAALARLARVMRKQSELRFVTDIDDYSGWTLARVSRSSHFRWDAQSARDWRLPWADWTTTRYEEKALREGRSPCYFIFIRD